MKNLVSIFCLCLLVLLGLAACNRYDDKDTMPDTVVSKVVLVNDNFFTAKNKSVKLIVLNNDNIISNGSLSFRTPANGSIQGLEDGFYYTPALDFTGSDEFYYRYCLSGSTACDSAKVSVTMN